MSQWIYRSKVLLTKIHVNIIWKKYFSTHTKLWHGIIHPCPNFNDSFDKPSFTWQRGWIITIRGNHRVKYLCMPQSISDFNIIKKLLFKQFFYYFNSSFETVTWFIEHLSFTIAEKASYNEDIDTCNLTQPQLIPNKSTTYRRIYPPAGQCLALYAWVSWPISLHTAV